MFITVGTKDHKSKSNIHSFKKYLWGLSGDRSVAQDSTPAFVEFIMAEKQGDLTKTHPAV